MQEGEHPVRVTDDEPAELTVGAVRELVERLGRLEKQIAELRAAVADHETHIQRGILGSHPPIEALRANGVTRYKRGDVEIELQPGAEVPVRELIKAWPHPGDIDPAPGEGSPLPLDDVEPNGTEGALEEELSPLPPFGDLKRQSEDLRRQHEADRGGVEVTEVDVE
jgi:hypothetical protein